MAGASGAGSRLVPDEGAGENEGRVQPQRGGLQPVAGVEPAFFLGASAAIKGGARRRWQPVRWWCGEIRVGSWGENGRELDEAQQTLKQRSQILPKIAEIAAWQVSKVDVKNVIK